jgi:hypothetical protein
VSGRGKGNEIKKRASRTKMKRRERGNWKFKLDGPKRGEGRGEKRSECEEGNFIAGETDWARRKN